MTHKKILHLSEFDLQVVFYCFPMNCSHSKPFFNASNWKKGFHWDWNNIQKKLFKWKCIIVMRISSSKFFLNSVWMKINLSVYITGWFYNSVIKKKVLGVLRENQIDVKHVTWPYLFGGFPFWFCNFQKVRDQFQTLIKFER